MTTLILVRHGQTAWNVNERFRGREDIPLDDVGRTQAELTAERIARQWKPAAVYCSPLSRARATGEAIARRCGVALDVRPGLIDIDYGRWQGMAPSEARLLHPRSIRLWYRGSRWARPPGGEPLRAVKRRALQAVLEIVASHPDQAVAAVGHTVVNRAILLGALSAGLRHFWQLGQEPCAVNIIEVEGSSFTLRSVNDTCHLQGSG
ncbi:MAG: histidine phosphatase family protein [Spirochaetales bacterium]|nr:histidine phosphatase family protein [Spirochaetales bacterium]